jgi:hypothetical protein
MRRYRWLGVATLTVAVLSSCGGPVVASTSPPLQGPIPAASSVPAASSYGHGSWAFTVSFLAVPTDTGVRTAPIGSGPVARDTYRARFKTNVGEGVEQLRIIEQPHKLTGPCVLGLLFAFPKGRCPKPHGDILSSGVQGCPQHAVIVGIACHGYIGTVVAQRQDDVLPPSGERQPDDGQSSDRLLCTRR